MKSLLRFAAISLFTIGAGAGNTVLGQNLIVNGNFATHPAPFSSATDLPPGTDLGQWKSGVPYAGTAVYPFDTRVAVQTGPVSYANEVIVQNTFPGDPEYGVPASNTWLYSNGNNTGSPFTIWSQRVVVQPDTKYTFSYYASSAIAPGKAAPYDPMLQLLVDDKPEGKIVHVYNDGDKGSGHKGQDLWDRHEVEFFTGSGATSIELKLTDKAGGINGDDLALTAFSLKLAPFVALYPNPAVTKTQLNMSSLPAGDYQVTLVDMTGRAVRQTTLTGGSTHRLDVHDLAVGSYVVLVRGPKFHTEKRLLKQ